MCCTHTDTIESFCYRVCRCPLLVCFSFFLVRFFLLCPFSFVLTLPYFSISSAIIAIVICQQTSTDNKQFISLESFKSTVLFFFLQFLAIISLFSPVFLGSSRAYVGLTQCNKIWRFLFTNGSSRKMIMVFCCSNNER